MPTPSFRTVRWVRTLNLLAQAVLFLTFFGGLNYLAVHYAWRFDLTAHRRYSLSPETLSYLQSLRQPVRIVVTLTDDGDNAEITQAYRDVGGLLREYAYATEGNERGRVTVDFIDIYQRRRDAEELNIAQPNTILVLSGPNRTVVDLDKLYRVENRERKAFLGEQAFTAAILDVSSTKKQKVYFLKGHGEMQIDDAAPARGLSALFGELRLRNFEVEQIDLSEKRKVPDDATVLVIAGPQGRYDPFEEELLRQYLANRAGRVIALLGPLYPHGLDSLLYDDWGILADDDLIYDRSAEGQSDTGDLILTASATTPHDITRAISSYRIPLRFGASRSLRPALGRTLDASLEVTPLIGTTGSAPAVWGERDYRRRDVPKFDSGIDLPGPLPVAIASERKSTRAANLPFSVPGGRLVAYGSADWIANGRLATVGNLSLFLATVNWTADRTVALNVPARPVEQFQLALNQQQLQRLRTTLLFALPGAVALLGIIVYWTRRR